MAFNGDVFLSMDEWLLASTVVLFGSLLWYGIQVGTWYALLRQRLSYQNACKLLLAGIIVVPLFVFLVLGFFALVEGAATMAGLLLPPSVTVYVIFVSWLGLKTAARLRTRRQKLD